MDMQGRVRRFEARLERDNEAWATFCKSFNEITAELVDGFWDAFMEMSEKSRDRLAPDWRERHDRWMEHRTGTGE